jgi:hypothetical protein
MAPAQYGMEAAFAGAMTFFFIGAIGAILVVSGARSGVATNRAESGRIMRRARDLGERRRRTLSKALPPASEARRPEPIATPHPW